MASPEIYSGSTTLFKMTTPPIGWTKDTNYNNHTLRVVTGTGSASSGGTTDFATVFASLPVSASATVAGAIGGTALGNTQIPAHTHKFYSTSPTASGFTAVGSPGNTPDVALAAPYNQSSPLGLSSSGSGATHTHPSGDVGFSWSSSSTINLAVKYVDVIIATRN